MSFTIYPSHAYALVGGMIIGKFTNLFSDIIITGLVTYIVAPKVFTYERIEQTKNYLLGLTGFTKVLFNHYRPSSTMLSITNSDSSAFNTNYNEPKINLLSPDTVLKPLPPLNKVK
jgi:hypothetical protein